jgi:anaerobic ribonucleoside-triphosphate reductase activating protein
MLIMMLVNGVKVAADPALTNEEITAIVEDELQAWQRQGKNLGKVELSVDGEEVIIKAVEKSPVRRVRRITGYLSNVDNFNDAKRAECASRTTHLSV